jgi:hypothetical protein
VLDEWNPDGFIAIGTVLPGHSQPACTGLIAEQAGKRIGSQYLRGGSKQAVLKLPREVAKQLSEAAERVKKSGYEVVEAGGMRWELKATGWNDVNGIHGYTQAPGIGSVQTERLPKSTIAKKVEED